MKGGDQVLTLADSNDTWNFYVGCPIEMTWPDGKPIRPATRWERLRNRLVRTLLRWTRWFRSRTVVSQVDVDEGCVTLAYERWSWLRWRWERR